MAGTANHLSNGIPWKDAVVFGDRHSGVTGVVTWVLFDADSLPKPKRVAHAPGY